jgi:catechol 2,3-dioxygenase-like lactoylglutathione lyase family enzyme
MATPAHNVAPAIDSVAHVTIPVGDLDQAEAFYVDLLGAELIGRFDRAAFLRYQPMRATEADADNSPLHLAIKFGDSPEFHLFLQRAHTRRTPAPHPHIALAVDADELDTFRARLVDAGVPLDGPRRLGGPGHASLYFADPWGQLLELVTTGYEGSVEPGPPDAAKLGYEAPLRIVKSARG